MGPNSPIGRRSFITTTAATVGVGSIASVAAAGQSKSTDPDESKGPLELENGELKPVLSGDGNTLRTQNKQSLPDDQYPVDLLRGVERLNELQRQGLVRFYEDEGRVMVAITEKARSKHSLPRSDSEFSSKSIQTEGCGKTKYKLKTPELLNPWFWHKFFLDDEDTQEAALDLQGGAALVVVIGGIFSLPSGGSASAVATILGGTLGLGSYALQKANDGCGVLIKVKHLPIPPSGSSLDHLTYRVKLKTQ